MGNVWVAAFDNNGLALTDGFHTLTTTSTLPMTPTIPLSPTNPFSGRYYNAFVYGYGPAGTNTSYGYLAGYNRKLNSDFIICPMN